MAVMFRSTTSWPMILLSHMGESNPRLSDGLALLTDAEFPYNTCGDTAAVYTCFREGPVVYANLAPMREGLRLILFQAEMVKAPYPDGAYRRATQGWLRPPLPLREFLKAYSELGGTHHSAMVYGDHMAELRAFGEMMGFETVVIG